MNKTELAEILNLVRSGKPLVHCITNYVTVNDVANMVLACGASPVMADDSAEAADITALCNATLINIGTLNARTVESMVAAGVRANGVSHPVVLDPVGAGASKFRTDTTFMLLDKIRFSVIRGNSSEIKTIARGTGTTQGVDADTADSVTDENLSHSVELVKRLAEKTGAVIAMTGAIDIIADAQSAYICRNGHPMLGSITGSGCMLSAVAAAFCGASSDKILEASAVAVSAMGLCGETAYRETCAGGEGTGSFRTRLLDAMSLLVPVQFEKGCRLEKV